MTENYWLFELDDDEAGLIALGKRKIVEYVIEPLQALLSKTAIKAYLTTALVTVVAFFLLLLAFAAYILFYWSYIPQIGFESAIHLQFDNVFDSSQAYQNSLGVVRTYPYGHVDIAPYVISNQRYDIAVEITLPRTAENIAAGNFMLDVALKGPAKKRAATELGEAIRDGVLSINEDNANVLARSRRPAIIPYRSRITDLVYRISELHWYLLGARQESEKIRISAFEGVSFAQGWRNIPTSLRLEVQSIRRMQFYEVKVYFKARFSGLRWFMYNYQFTATVVFVSWFWTTELLFAAVAWAAIVYSENDPATAKSAEVHEIAERVKQEGEDDEKKYMSDTDRTFPTLSSQTPLRYQSPDVKQEEMPTPLQAAPVPGLEADDEDEDADTFMDSGLGTSLESGPGRSSSMRKRRNKPSVGDR
ncbi:hypothetical protein AMS68_000642 [Peltaster fructicola]|uniref:Seipin n=1 Tax=Peltaster fructicola TaxID=286661 RepID=A0A6H0XKH3_9PEZI|nr:hypothetical protein AMS68_000642 [Peltaster fructicola]